MKGEPGPAPGSPAIRGPARCENARWGSSTLSVAVCSGPLAGRDSRNGAVLSAQVTPCHFAHCPCHAEGRGFESLHPLSESPARRGFSLPPVATEHVSTDMLGQAYEWLIAKFAATSGKGDGEFYTPAEVGRLAAGLLEPKKGARIYDPTCGSGGLLRPQRRSDRSVRSSHFRRCVRGVSGVPRSL
jgi:N-6 DNA Methylase